MYQINFDKSLRSALLLGAASAAVFGLSPAASAQETQETVVVTGSRIPQVGLYSSSPVTAVGQQEFKFQGTTNVETLINNLPSVTVSQNSTVTNGVSATANVDLRGLNCVRTLVLVNGRRLMPGDPSDTCADLNDIPADLVDHVEVLTGGASAVYGSDAVAGVVNFIMRKNFEGIELDGQYSLNNASNDNGFVRGLEADAGFATAKQGIWDGQTKDGTLILGTNSDNGKANITAYLSYHNTPGIYSGQRDYSACALNLTNHNNTLRCAGSANSNYWISIDNAVGGTPYSFFQEGTGHTGSGNFVPFCNASGCPSDHYFNYGPLQYLQRPDTRYNGGFFAHYDVNKALEVYSEFMFTGDQSRAALAPSAAFLGTGPFSGYNEVNCTNPYMTQSENATLCGLNTGDNLISNPADPIVQALGHPYWDGAGNLTPGQSTLLIGRRFVESGHRFYDIQHQSYRMTIGAKGDLGGGWSYDVYGQYGYTSFQEHDTNQVSDARVQDALQVDPLNPTQCLGGQTGCVPLDIFNGYGSITQPMLGWATVSTLTQGFTEEQILSGSVTGDLGSWGLQSPWAKNPVAVSVGSEYRAEYLEFSPDTEGESGDISGGGIAVPQPKAGYSVKEGFTEVRVPLIQNMQFVEDLTLNGGYRYSSYSTAGTSSAYKWGAEWQPVDDFRFRASYNRAVRAPNVLELFTPASVQLFSGDDPCSANGNPAWWANCASGAGIPLAERVPNAGSTLLNCTASQCQNKVGGNLNLRPETSDTRTVGIVLTPTFFDGFTATVDYFNIIVHNAISNIDPTFVLDQCYDPNAPDPGFFCALVHRNNNHGINNGPNGYVIATQVNTGFIRTKGMDFAANYTTDLNDWGMGGYGGLSFSFIGTLLETYTEKETPASGSFGCAGFYGGACGLPRPKWRHSLRTTWTTPWNFDLSLNWRYFGDVALTTDRYVVNDAYDAKIGTYNWFDLAATYNVREGVELRAGVTNIFDKEPPILSGAQTPLPYGNGNTFPGTYDSLGRTIFVGATIKY